MAGSLENKRSHLLRIDIQKFIEIPTSIPCSCFSLCSSQRIVEADLGLGQEMTSVQPVPPTPDFPSAENFGIETTKPLEEFPAEGFADANFGFGPAETEKDEKGKRKKEKKEKKKKGEKGDTKDEMSFGAEATFGQDSSLDPKPEVKESWPSFGNEEMIFGLQDKAEKAEKTKQRKKKDTQKESTNDLSWPDLQTESSPVPHFGSTDRPSDMTGTAAGMAGVGTVPQPRTRLGLPVESHTSQTDRDRDPDYVARLEEILGVSKQVRHQEAALRARLDKENSRWAGRRNDGHFEESRSCFFSENIRYDTILNIDLKCLVCLVFCRLFLQSFRFQITAVKCKGM